MVPPARAHVSVVIVLLCAKAEGHEARRIVTPSTPAKRKSLCRIHFLYATAWAPVPGKSMPHPDALSLSLLLYGCRTMPQVLQIQNQPVAARIVANSEAIVLLSVRGDPGPPGYCGADGGMRASSSAFVVRNPHEQASKAQKG